MARTMRFIHRIGLTVVIFSFIVLFFTLGRNALHNNNNPKTMLPTLHSTARFLQPVFGQTHLNSNSSSSGRVRDNTVSKMDQSATLSPLQATSPTPSAASDDRIVLAVVVCGDRANETLVMLKSAAAFTSHPLHFVIMADDGLRQYLHNGLSAWPESIFDRVSYRLHPITFPMGEDANEWRKLFKPCASQRLFLPTILKDVDSLLYVDTDVLFLRPLEQLWHFFAKMNASQMAAMTPEHEDFATGWYNRFARHPYYKPLGVNSGVMLMNLTRMRAFEWQSRILPIYREYKYRITWGDQDIINIIFHYHPEKVYIYPCEWNFRSDHCMYTSVCKSAEERGVGVLHGNRAVFHGNQQPAFRAVYEAFEKYNLGEDPNTHLLTPMDEALQETLHTNCGKMRSILLRSLRETVAAMTTT